ncbi:MAG: Vms1/Ankzf1 family peptidyl-tRNA hydrolase [Halorhabdus sp.]
MLDELLGRARLKERIEELEEENHHLQRQLDAESERRADVETERQAAERRANRLEDRVAELEDRVDRLSGTEQDLSVRHRERVRGDRLSAVLNRLETFDTDPEGALTAFVDDGSLPDVVSDAFGDRAGLVSRAAPCFAFIDDAGLVSVTLEAPIEPDPFVTWDEGFVFDRSHFEPTGDFTFALVRSDLFAMGEYRGRERVAFHGFDSDLERNHSKGGFSQARFERLRDEQIETHLERCRAALEERSTDRLYVVGEETVLDEFAEAADAMATVDATGDPEPALETAFRDFWTTTLSAI